MTNMTDAQEDALQRVVMYLWNDEERDFKSNPDDGHIFASLIRLREFLEHEGVEVFPEPDWHKAIIAKEAQKTSVFHREGVAPEQGVARSTL